MRAATGVLNNAAMELQVSPDLTVYTSIIKRVESFEGEYGVPLLRQIGRYRTKPGLRMVTLLLLFARPFNATRVATGTLKVAAMLYNASPALTT
jgi:hypothetical protein